MTSLRRVLVVDSSVLINFLAVERLDLLTEFAVEILITEHVRTEVTEPEQIARLEEALALGTVREVRVEEQAEVDTFLELSASGRLGSGECSAIACAM